MAEIPRLRHLRGRDPLGLRRALADRLLPALVGAMALLAALGLAGAQGAGRLAERWQAGAAGQLLLQLPPETEAGPLVERLAALPGTLEATLVPEERLRQLIAPWLGEVPGLPLPRMVALTLRPDADQSAFLDVVQAIPGAQLETQGAAVRQALRLAEGLQALSVAMLGVIALVGAALVAVATRAGIAARRETILILHELGARDSDIAGRFARRLARLCALGAAGGGALAVPALWALADQAIPVVLARQATAADLPWVALAALPLVAAGIGWATALVTLRAWLRRLP
ncbi:FtsX-like permease family protein [Roseococcus sp. SYP-B2431]|uniref:cell division protein FtsX n=1 Tax=Roseococcus sp. SYP-B2431 TaxID=2496640 RepID=UPI00103DBA49|nr:FtsX-like permease family protein [Roseococcus sp. SYP-B2431]TCH96140.1 FtsX-like permease family protein [Roseococcus sp. SYP-B2431]